MVTLLEQIKGDDLDVFFDADSGFAVTAKYSSEIDGEKDIPVIFDREVQSLDPYSGVSIITDPQVAARTADVPNIRHQDTIEIDNVVYEIKRLEPDDFGATVLFLNKTRDDNC